MKKLPVLFGIFVAIIIAGTTFAEVEVKDRRPLPGSRLPSPMEKNSTSNFAPCAMEVGGKGDGPAAPAMTKPVPDLTVLAAKNDGTYPP